MKKKEGIVTDKILSLLSAPFFLKCESQNQKVYLSVPKVCETGIITFSSWMRRYWFYVKNDFRKFHQIFTS